MTYYTLSVLATVEAIGFVMLFGVLSGFFSAFLQSSSYVLSRRFLLRSGNAAQLVVCSQFVMCLFGAATLAATVPFVRFPATWSWFGLLCLFVLFSNVGYFCFFRALREIEASRLSSLLGLKIIVLAVVSMTILKQPVSGLQWAAVALSAVAAVGMNFTGGPLTRKGCLYLFLTLVAYAGADTTETTMIQTMPGESLFANSLAVTGAAFTALGLVSSVAFLRVRCSWKTVRAAVPYAIAWYSAMIFLFASFGAIGVLFGNIIQASRGLISIFLGLLLLRIGFDSLEPRVSRRAWIRRAIMAVFMLAAMALYSAARA